MPSSKAATWLASGAAGAIIGGTLTGAFNYLSQRRDLDHKMIELSVSILRAQPTPETEPLREWAIDVIGKREGFQFNNAQRAALLKKELPFKTSEAELMAQQLRVLGITNLTDEQLRRMEQLLKNLQDSIGAAR
jgi:hypothetical protein